jgi:aminoglycoside 3-N-acetyltransferase
VYSFAVIGHEAPRFAGLDHTSAYGEDSPFGLLRALDGRIGVLDLIDQDSMTYVHHVEECCGAPWRYTKAFEADYTDAQGQTRRKRYTLYVRDLERGVETWVDPLGERLWAEGMYQGHRPHHQSGLRLVSARALYERVRRAIADGSAEGLIYRIQAPTP